MRVACQWSPRGKDEVLHRCCGEVTSALRLTAGGSYSDILDFHVMETHLGKSPNIPNLF